MAARKTGHSGGACYARKSGWPGGGAFPGGEVDDEWVESEEESEEEEDSERGSEEEGGSEAGDCGGQEGQEAGESTLAVALRDALQAADAPGDFATGGRLRLVLPGLELVTSGSGENSGGNSKPGSSGGKGSGGVSGENSGGGSKAEVVGLPLSEAAAAALKAAGELAPFGRRGKTLRDTTVRHTWQLDPDGFRLSNPQWRKTVDTAVAKCCDGLGVTGVEVEAQLYKLLLYEEGSHFGVHRDSEKADGMWGTLVLHLPTAYEGGQLVVSHAGRTQTFDFSANSAYGMHYAAFYADCNHEIKLVTSGHRLVLVYNLVSKAADRRPQPADHSDAVAAAKGVVQRWEQQLEEGGEDAPAKLVYLLDHWYSQDGLRAGLAALKGADRAAGQVLAALQDEELLDVHLASVELDEWGNDGDYFESLETMHQWVGLDGRPAPEYGKMSLRTDEELCQGAYYFVDTDPDGEEQESDTGNEGAPCTRWYRRTALVVWPRSRRYHVRCEGDLKRSADGLLQAIRQGSKARTELHQWAAALLRSLLGAPDAGVVSAVLGAVAELRDARLAEQCLVALSKAGAKGGRYPCLYSSGIASCVKAEHAPAVVQLCQLAGWSKPSTLAVESLLCRLADCKARALPSCVALLRYLHKAASVPEGASGAAATAAAGPAAGAAGAAPAGAAAAAAALLTEGLAKVAQAVASLPRADVPTRSFTSGYENSRLREVQAQAGTSLTHLLSLLCERGDDSEVESFLSKAYARHFIAAADPADDSDCAGMLPPLLVACGGLGWSSPRTAAVLTATAAACVATPASHLDFLELAQGVQATAGQAAAVLVPQLTAAYLQALPPARPSNVYLNAEENPGMRALLDWLAEQDNAEHFGTIYKRAAASIDLEVAVEHAVRVGQAKAWWAEVQPGLLAAFSRGHSEGDMPAVLQQLQRVRQASRVHSGTTGAGTPANADSRQRYLQLAAAVVGAMEAETDRDMNPRPPRFIYRRGRRYAYGYSSMPSMPPRTAEFVQDLLLAVYVPGCPESEQLLGRATLHICRCPLRYPVDRLVVPAMEGLAEKLQLGSLAAAVQAEPALRAMVQQAANELRKRIPRPPAWPSDWSRRPDAPRVSCCAAGCTDCPAVRAFLENPRQSEQRFVMGVTRRKHLASALRRAGVIAGFNWRDDGVAIVCSKRGDYEVAVAEFNCKNDAWQRLQAALGSGAAQAAQQQRQQQQQQLQRAGGPRTVTGLPEDCPAVKKRRF